MKRIHLSYLVVTLLLFAGCTKTSAPTPSAPVTPTITQQMTSTQQVLYDDMKVPLVVTFANESKSAVNFMANVDGQDFSMELPSAAQLGGYNGQEFTVKTIMVPDKQFVLELTEKNTGMKIQKTLDPVEGEYIAVTFWGDKFTIDQSVQKQVRID